MNIEEIQMIGAVVYMLILGTVVCFPVFVAIKSAREDRTYLEFLESAGPMSPEDIAKIDFGPAAYNNVVTGDCNVYVGYTDANGRVPESPVMIGGVKCEYCGRINSRDVYYCDGCQAPINESQAKADRIALRY